MIQVNEMPTDKDFLMVWHWDGYLHSESFTFLNGTMMRYYPVEDEFEPANMLNFENIIPIAKFYLTHE
ncbi:hypothetical protein [Escherichia phage vB_EcoS_SCS44]|nr:hypothetical protein [Escherichia phage 590B]UOL50932.1 hypothetical protein [Escherichia phage vB_EcoS_SCS44]